MAQIPMKLVVDVVEVKGFTNGVINPCVVVIFAGEKRKAKTRTSSRVTQYMMKESFEFPFDVEGSTPPELLIQVKEQQQGLMSKTKFVGGVNVVITSDFLGSGFGAMGKAKEAWFTLKGKDDNSAGEVKLKIRVERGMPQRRAPPRATQQQGNNSAKPYGDRKPRGNLPMIISIVRDKDESSLEHFLSHEPKEEINSVTKSGNSCLHEACMERAESILLLLLNNENTDINLRNSHDNTPLHYFCEFWNSPHFMNCFTVFLKRGANVNALNSNGESPIYKAITNSQIRSMLMEALIAHEADVNILSTSGEGLLHYAVRYQREDLLKIILQASPRLDLRGNKGKTAYELAIEHNFKNIADYLKQVEELFKWMETADISAYKANFVKDEITLQLLPEITEASLGQMGIESVGARMKIMKAIRDKVANGSSSTVSTSSGNGSALPTSNGVPLFRKKQEIPEKQLDELQRELAAMRQGQSDWIIDIKDLEFLKPLGSGASGDVYKGLFKETHQVAIKVLKEMTADQEVDEFKKEFEILSTVRHPNVVFFYGASFQPKLCMVMEFCSRGNLHSVLRENATEVGWDRAITICKETCAGLQALHAVQILHRDLKSPNLLVTEQWHIKLCDFGLSRFNTKENMETMKQMRGTFAYCDPEVYNGGIFTAASDIYSLAVIFWEIVNRVIKKKYDQPYSEFKHLTFDFQIIIQAAKEDLRPTIPPTCPPVFKDLITRTWNKAQKARPNLDTIIKCLDIVAENYAANKTQWDHISG